MGDTFQYRSKTMRYFDDPYNSTRLNERAIEIPAAFSVWGMGDQTLEIGAVTPHYIEDWESDPGHTVIDLYEVYPHVLNEDVLAWEPGRLFDLIISISTLEHLGSAERTTAAIQRLKGWLAPGGEMFITLPYWDYITPELIAALNADYTVRYDKVDPVNHLWTEADQNTPPLDYDGRSKWANSVWFLVFHA